MCGFTILYPATENRHNLILFLAREINFSRVPPPPKKIPAGATVPIPCNFVRNASDKTIPSCYGIDHNYSIAKYTELVAQFSFHRLV